MATTTNRHYRFPAATASTAIPQDVQHLAEDVDADVQMAYDDLTSAVPTVGTGTDITVSAPGDARAAGSTGRYADAAHKHGREASTSVTIPLSQGFFIPYGLTLGLSLPKWVATANCTLQKAYANLSAGSGAKYQVFVNGAAPAGMVDSGAVGTTTVLFDFPDITVNAGDSVQIKVTNVGTSATDLSVTLGGVWR